MAFGLVVRSMGVAKSIGAGFKAMRQGEVTQYTELLEDSRRHAIDRMIENARLLGGNAVCPAARALRAGRDRYRRVARRVEIVLAAGYADEAAAAVEAKAPAIRA